MKKITLIAGSLIFSVPSGTYLVLETIENVFVFSEKDDHTKFPDVANSKIKLLALRCPYEGKGYTTWQFLEDSDRIIEPKQ